ncbi:hypothetical protein SGFS_037740 [Streptomyces graminofaciens]|uniref:Secreted protein n=1 Tax=Streptomyces graminofaciens TaxID=68212 RepID=A0ABN5VIQ6_9ACTN|nr:hypothetical protein SGFS_037740 [Streptomyces graminofaciens]
MKNFRHRRTVTTPALGMLLAGILSLGSGAPASASDASIMARPTNCHYEVWGYWGSVANCQNHNGGSYRALVRCKYPEGKVRAYEGPWKQTADSRAYCQGDSKPVSAGIETRV